jgi:lipoate-protein ligase B
MSPRALLTSDLGVMPYGEALELQRAVARARISGEIAEDVLLLVEHPAVVTTGRTTKGGHMLASAELLRSRRVELFDVERGGDVTFHGPGQLVGYPIIDLKGHKKDLHWYLRQVEQALIDALGTLDLIAERNPGFTGVWTRGQPEARNPHPNTVRDPQPSASPSLRKIASIGVHARDWVTWHGFALNVRTDLSFFDLIVPCGIDGVVMTSIERELGTAVPDDVVRSTVSKAFADLFSLYVTPYDARAAVAALT